MNSMVISLNIKHIFKYPVSLVVDTHLTKYPTEKEKFVQRVETIERQVDLTKGIDYRRRLAFCENVVPNILRKISLLNEKNLVLQEEAWLDLNKRHMTLKSRNITWAKYADMWEESRFAPVDGHPHWTMLEQRGHIAINNLGPLGRLLEMFAEKFLYNGLHRSLKVMEDLLHERAQLLDSQTDS